MEKTIETQNINDKEIRYAGFWIRVLAVFIDFIIVSIAMGLIFGILGMFFTSYIWFMIVMPISTFLIVLIYNIAMVDKYQATLGKKICKLKVVNENDLQKIPFFSIVTREGIKYLVFLLFMPIHVFVAFMPKKQGIHDMAANTIVIHK